MRFSVLHHLESAVDAPAPKVYAEVEEQVRTADALGFDTAWVAEHHFSATRGRSPEPLLLLVHLAAHTARIRVGSAVLPVPLYQPLRLAEGVAMTDVLTGGRLACGLSSGAGANDMRAFGVEQEGKHARLEETLVFLRRAWAGQPVPTAADGVPDEEARLVVLPIQRPEDMVWVAASSHPAARVAGLFGFHLLLPVTRAVETSAEHVQTYRAALAEAGCDARTRRIQLTMHVVIDADHAAALRTAEPLARAYYEGYVRGGTVSRLADESPAAIMARINFAAGGPEAVADMVRSTAAALGLTDIAFQFRLNGLSTQQMLRGIELVAKRVQPLVADAPAGAGR